MSRFTGKPKKQGWEDMPPEEIKKMIQLQKNWENKLPYSLKDFSCLIRQLSMDPNKDNKDDGFGTSTSTSSTSAPKFLSVETIMKKTSCLLFTATHMLTNQDIYNNLNQMDHLIDTTCKVDSVPFEYYSAPAY